MYYLKKEGHEIFETEFWAMADRKIAQGWDLCSKPNSQTPEVAEVISLPKPKKKKVS